MVNNDQWEDEEDIPYFDDDNWELEEHDDWEDDEEIEDIDWDYDL